MAYSRVRIAKLVPILRAVDQFNRIGDSILVCIHSDYSRLCCNVDLGTKSVGRVDKMSDGSC